MIDAAPFARGRDADVFALPGGRVLRRYRDGGDTAPEAEVMRYVAGLGFPAPRVYEAGGPDLVMERVEGPTMLGALAGGLDLDEAGAILARLAADLHALPPMPGFPPGARILHLDLHPENVLLTADGPVLIDWRNAAPGSPGLDLALSALILAEVATGSIEVPAAPADLPRAARAVLAAFLAAAGGDPLGGLATAVEMRRDNPTLSAAEKAGLDGAASLVRSLIAT
ncbi:phosphotransferase [Rhizomonospora bruguierae]|uniref:phosphotransferase n=1 Tax=Rhizomonospora bruguierae TaxID=1581705 RepID=UPI001BCDABA2|nr:phosphotransferase [Micromonospora sp. NBRC 107566]